MSDSTAVLPSFAACATVEVNGMPTVFCGIPTDIAQRAQTADTLVDSWDVDVVDMLDAVDRICVARNWSVSGADILVLCDRIAETVGCGVSVRDAIAIESADFAVDNAG